MKEVDELVPGTCQIRARPTGCTVRHAQVFYPMATWAGPCPRRACVQGDGDEDGRDAMGSLMRGTRNLRGRPAQRLQPQLELDHIVPTSVDAAPTSPTSAGITPSSSTPGQHWPHNFDIQLVCKHRLWRACGGFGGSQGTGNAQRSLCVHWQGARKRRAAMLPMAPPPIRVAPVGSMGGETSHRKPRSPTNSRR